ncbi:serine/threonine-protein kinase PrkC-like isoform X2 [Anopheles albimanus]|uniref:serine/threonine-protein kinase PrkC-like isoform X2 n=1 Tax=Anopheles albimanus TaxID=7167 RepID=UPI001640AB40|nr:serine/threonine-protein kinase PrkC-like isoform X2 [Anopheles albimanus]
MNLKGYKILEFIGRGAFSNVFCVRDRELGTYFAAKQLSEEIENAEDIANLPEVSLIRRIGTHPNVLNIVDVIYENKRLTIIMDLMDINLYEYITARKRPLSENRARRFLLQVITGVDHLHRHGIFHRDIKPENILIKRVKGVVRKLLGTPSKSMLMKIKHCNMGVLEFRKYPPEDFRTMLPLVSAYGIDMLKKTLSYLPDQRISASRLLKHIYFQDVTEHKKWSKFSMSFSNLDKEFQNLDLQPDSVCTVCNLDEFSGKSTKPCSSAWSVRSKESILSNKTVHYFPLEGQRERNRALERLWDMNNTAEKQNLWKQIRDPRRRRN